MYFDKADPKVHGIADALLDFRAFDLDPALGVQRETIKADTAGRYIWATKGFQFDPKYYYYDVDGKTYKTSEIARRNLARFLKKHRIPVAKLILHGSPVAALDELRTPADFAELRHKDGKTIRLRPLVSQGTHDEEILGDEADLPVGKAFMLASYRPAPAPPYVLSQGGPFRGQKFAPDAMPWWNGFRQIPASRSK